MRNASPFPVLKKCQVIAGGGARAKAGLLGRQDMIGKTISRYRVLEKLGEGGMGVVCKAEDTEPEREVALKFLPRQIAAQSEERQRFKVEAKAAAALSHPNIETIYNVEERDFRKQRNCCSYNETTIGLQ